MMYYSDEACEHGGNKKSCDGYWLRIRGWCGTLRLHITRASPLRQVSRSTLSFLPYIEHAPIQRNSRQGQSVQIFPTCEADGRQSR